MTDNCYLDTTILVEALLKELRRRRSARQAVRSYGNSTVSVYAIKEFKAGALSNAVWLHNRLAETGSYRKTIAAQRANFRKPGKVFTSLEIVEGAFSKVVGSDLAAANTAAATDELIADTLMVEVHRLVKKAWADRNSITTEVIQDLGCFTPDAPYYDEETKMIFIGVTGCPAGQDCSYAPGLRRRKRDLDSLLKAIEGETRPEDNRRRKALHTLKNTPNRPFDNKQCRALGDAYFALHCPAKAIILTSNVKDHAPLAAVLGHTVTEYR